MRKSANGVHEPSLTGSRERVEGMEYTHLGRSGLSVSRLCLGTMNFGTLTPPEEAYAIMDRAHELGINFFDTANTYGRRQSPPGQVADNDQSHAGWTEEILGDWFAKGGGRRERTVLSTKLYGDMGTWPNEGKLSALNIRRACDASLRRLRTDYIDLYQMHHVDRDTPWDEIWQAMEVLVAQGKILYAGSSNFAGWHIAQANETARARGFLGLVSEQSLYNLVTREIELEVLPAARAYGVGVIPWSPLGGGLLGGVLKRDSAANHGAGRRRLAGIAKAAVEARREAIAAYEDLCDKLGEEPADVALAWLLRQDGVTAPIIGPRTIEQLDGAQRALGVTLDDAVLAQLDEIFPGHKTAPEDYAW
jgi:aryl-alcohol dehydrogenase-like predicted oxidoreductase